MQCPTCSFQNRDEAKFCGECGNALNVRCPACEFKNLPTNSFCDECGESLSSRNSSRVVVAESGDVGTNSGAEPVALSLNDSHLPDVERRQLCAMCCDLVGSSKLAHELDPEDWRDALNSFHGTCRVVTDEYGAHYAQHLGDGFMVYFGYPIAHGNDAERAVLAGLRILEHMRELNRSLRRKFGIELKTRIGIDTGLVVVGDIHSKKRHASIAVGEPPNIASRVQDAAKPNTVLITEATRRLVPERFDYDDLGIHELKNVEPSRLFRVIGEKATPEVQIASDTSQPLVGRELELGLLLERWGLTKESYGQVVMLVGEPGIGKSKLVQEFKAATKAEAHIYLECRGSPFHENSALYPVIDYITRASNIRRIDDDNTKLGKLGQLLSRFRNADEMLPLIAKLLSTSGPVETDSRAETPDRLRQRTLDVLVGMVLEQASHGPTVFIVEDVHWLDPTTLEMLKQLIPLTAGEPVYTLMTARPNFVSPWDARSYLTQVQLNRLPRNRVEDMIQDITGGKELPARVRDQIVEKTDGVPLFIEELTKMVLEAGFMRQSGNRYDLVGELPEFAIPSTLQDSLTSRLDRLSTGRQVAQLAATLGREFSYELLEAVSPLDGQVLQEELRRLVGAELLYQRGTTLHDAVFHFKHSLIRDASYSLLTKGDRQAYHQKIAHVLVERFPETVEAHPEIVAHHYSEAGLDENAVRYWHDAGKRAAERSAHSEAASHLERGLAGLRRLPESLQRSKSELCLQVDLGKSLRATKGWGVDSVGQTYTRALELCEQVGDGKQMLAAVLGKWTWHFLRAELAEAREMAEKLRGKNVDDPVHAVLRHQARGFNSFARGDFVDAHAQMDLSIGSYDLEAQSTYLRLTGQDPGVHVRVYDAKSLWFLGYPDQALQRSEEATQLAESLQHPFSQAIAKTIACRVHQLRGDHAIVTERAKEAIEFCADQQFVHYVAIATIMQGWAMAKRGFGTEGIQGIEGGIQTAQEVGASLYRPYHLALLAEAYAEVGRFKEALDSLRQAREQMAEGDRDRFYEAEILRLCGELCLQTPSGDSEQAERCFQCGLELARRQKAKSLELRVALSLCRLWVAQGRTEEARPVLSDAYEWFSEGFDTQDLVCARAMVAELN